MEAFPSHDRAAFNGKCLLIVRSLPGQRGELRIKAAAEGLREGDVTVETLTNP